MDSQSEKFPWKVCAAVIVLTVLAMSAGGVHYFMKDAPPPDATENIAGISVDITITPTEETPPQAAAPNVGAAPDAEWYMVEYGVCSGIRVGPDRIVEDLRSSHKENAYFLDYDKSGRIATIFGFISKDGGIKREVLLFGRTENDCKGILRAYHMIEGDLKGQSSNQAGFVEPAPNATF
jgi:hypothetical protein